jgi:ABC-type multidrug transport system permease subunit
MFNQRYQLVSSLRTAGWLLWCDMRLFFKDWHNNILDSLFWPLVLILANGYILPAMGMPADYGSFIVISMLIIMASFTAWSSANVLASDFEGARSIGYELTLPLPYWLVYIKIMVGFTIKAALFNLITLIIGKLILGAGFSLAQIHLGKFLLIYVLSCLFFSSFGLWASALAGNVARFMRLELRIAGPLFFICGYSFPWEILHKMAPAMGKLMLLTPWIYAYEGVRNSVFGPLGYLNYWLCCLMLIVFTVLFGFYGLWLFRRRLDCV